MTPELEVVTLRALSSRYMLLQALSVLSTHEAGCDHGASALCAPEEKEFLWETVARSLAGRELGSVNVERLQALFARASTAPYPVLRGGHLLKESLQLLELIESACGKQDEFFSDR